MSRRTVGLVQLISVVALLSGCGLASVFAPPQPRAFLVGGDDRRVHLVRYEGDTGELTGRLFEHDLASGITRDTGFSVRDAFAPLYDTPVLAFTGTTVRSDGDLVYARELGQDAPIIFDVAADTASPLITTVMGGPYTPTQVTLFSHRWILFTGPDGNTLALDRADGAVFAIPTGHNAVGFFREGVVCVSFGPVSAGVSVEARLSLHVSLFDPRTGIGEPIAEAIAGQVNPSFVRNDSLYLSNYRPPAHEVQIVLVRLADGVVSETVYPMPSLELGAVRFAGVTSTGCSVVVTLQPNGGSAVLRLLCPPDEGGAPEPRLLETLLLDPIVTSSSDLQVGAFGEYVVWQRPPEDTFVRENVVTGERVVIRVE